MNSTALINPSNFIVVQKLQKVGSIEMSLCNLLSDSTGSDDFSPLQSYFTGNISLTVT
jgi:hypothetical protein